MKKAICAIVITSLLLLLSIKLSAGQNAQVNSTQDDTIPTLQMGAKVFVDKCVLCHGSQGMGEGQIPLKIKGYPNTNIATPKKAKTLTEIHDVIVYGSILDNINEYMPPMGNELTWTEVESVSQFVLALRSDPEQVLKQVNSLDNSVVADVTLGLDVFQSRCVLCHGTEGVGDGRMAKIIKSPPPFNLTLSKMPKSYLSLIIEKGGEPIGRSPQMPPWGEQLSRKEIDAVVNYLLTLRK